MDNNDVQLVGGACGQHGSYTFYKAFKYTKNGIKRIVKLSEFFFVKLWIDSDLLCIGELQLLWIDKNSEQTLASLRLYFLPENTPEGRLDHGEDEVLAISEKVVIKVEDLVTWITADAEWTWGKLTIYESDVKSPEGEQSTGGGGGINTPLTISSLTESSLDFSDVEKERKLLDTNANQTGPSVIILSYPKYCRYRAMMKRLETVENDYLKYKVVNTLGGFPSMQKNTRVLFCRDTFDYPELEGHELLCNHLAPKLKGRPRGKRKKRSISPGSESNESESSVSNTFSKRLSTEGVKNGLRLPATRRSTRSLTENSESKGFIKKLNIFMKTNYTPIGRVPSLGYKELDLYEFFTKVQKLGGYDCVTSNRLWKSIYDDMSGHQNSTSAATIIRRHFERFLLPYERHINGLEYKPITPTDRRKLKSKVSESSNDDTSEGPSSSASSSVGSNEAPTTPSSPTDEKNFNVKSEGKVSLRSIRVKNERQKDKQSNDKRSINNNDINSAEIVVKEENKESPIIIEKVQMDIVKKEEPEDNNEAAVTIEKIDSENIVETKIKLELTIKNEPVVEEKPIVITKMEEPKPVDIIKIKSLPLEIKSVSPKIKTQSDSEKVNNVYIHEVKKRKLDILKEGGLEVTPVRPSVIQQIVSPAFYPDGVAHYSTKCPPPVLNPAPSHPKPSNLTVKFPPAIINGAIPPKVVQSKSIYSYSEKTIYGNPKDIFMQSELNPVITPKFANSGRPRPSGGDLLDLSVHSPQKPVVEIMRIPQIPSTSHNRDSVTKNLYKDSSSSSSSSSSKARLGSNLEITLVPPHNKPLNHYYPQSKLKRVNNYTNKIDVPKYPTSKPSCVMPTTNSRTKIPPLTPTPQQIRQIRHNESLYKNYPTPLPPTLPPLVPPPSFFDGHKDVPPFLPPYLSLIADPMYYMQTIYSNNIGLTPPPTPLYPSLTTPEPFSDLMAKSTRLAPYQLQKMPDNGSPSLHTRKS